MRQRNHAEWIRGRKGSGLLKENHPDYQVQSGFAYTERWARTRARRHRSELVRAVAGRQPCLGKDHLPDLTMPGLRSRCSGYRRRRSRCIRSHRGTRRQVRDVMMVTKLRIGDANTMMAEGGIQAADKPNDSPAQTLIWMRSAAVTSQQSQELVYPSS